MYFDAVLFVVLLCCSSLSLVTCSSVCRLCWRCYLPKLICLMLLLLTQGLAHANTHTQTLARRVRDVHPFCLPFVMKAQGGVTHLPAALLLSLWPGLVLHQFNTRIVLGHSSYWRLLCHQGLGAQCPDSDVLVTCRSDGRILAKADGKTWLCDLNSVAVCLFGTHVIAWMSLGDILLLWLRVCWPQNKAEWQSQYAGEFDWYLGNCPHFKLKYNM